MPENSVSNDSELDKLSAADRREIIVELWKASDRITRANGALLELIGKLSVRSTPRDLPPVAPQTVPPDFVPAEAPYFQPTIPHRAAWAVITFEIALDAPDAMPRINHQEIGVDELPARAQWRLWHELGRMTQRLSEIALRRG